MEQNPVQLDGIPNFRDLGGIPVAGGRVKPRLLYRCGRLSEASSAELDALTGPLGLTGIVDFRNAQERQEHPDPALPGVCYVPMPMFSDEELGVARQDNGTDPLKKFMDLGRNLQGGGARQLLRGMYPKMVYDSRNRGQLRAFFQILLQQDRGALLWHCTSGKDRTGVAAALLLAALGADRESVMEDYLETNRQQAESRRQLLEDLAARGMNKSQLAEIEDLETVDPSYLQSFFSAAAQAYGSLDRFLSEGLELGEPQRQVLWERYTIH